jgi:hypothetical protein
LLKKNLLFLCFGKEKQDAPEWGMSRFGLERKRVLLIIYDFKIVTLIDTSCELLSLRGYFTIHSRILRDLQRGGFE